MRKTSGLIACVLVLCVHRPAHAQNPRDIVQQAVKTELSADNNDHSRWAFFETDRKPERAVRQWVAETREGNLRRVVELNGHPLATSEQKSKMDAFVHDTSTRSRQRKNEHHDDEQAAELLRLLPDAFIWTYKGRVGANENLHFRPNPQFRPPDLESKVFAAMEGDMLVDAEQHRIVSLKGKLVHDVKLFGGFLGSLAAGGTFDVERRMTGSHVWQITETHVHINGRVLLFKTISEQEDDVKTQFRQLQANQDATMGEAETDLMRMGQ